MNFISRVHKTARLVPATFLAGSFRTCRPCSSFHRPETSDTNLSSAPLSVKMASPSLQSPRFTKSVVAAMRKL